MSIDALWSQIAAGGASKDVYDKLKRAPLTERDWQELRGEKNILDGVDPTPQNIEEESK